jgi:5'-deoxynucleotidase YfbR-like HD superfamily hydrolase
MLEQPQAYEAQAQQLAPDMRHLGELVLRLARINRATMLGPDGRPESDTDHTVMVALLAVALAEFDPQLDSGKVAKLALVHDVVEVESDDTQTFYPDEELLAGKKQREEAGFARLTQDYGGAFPWLIGLIDEYENGGSDEASLVKLTDKMVRAIVHLHDECNALRARRMTVEEHDRNVAKTREIMADHAARHPLVAALWQALDDQVRNELA